jgi:hypothetical protein
MMAIRIGRLPFGWSGFAVCRAGFTAPVMGFRACMRQLSNYEAETTPKRRGPFLKNKKHIAGGLIATR